MFPYQRPSIFLGRSTRKIPLLTQLKHTILASPRLLLCCIFSFGLALSYIYVSNTHLRDPTSFFYRPERAYDVNYSLTREFEADSIIYLAKNAPVRTKQTTTHPNYCVGIATVARPGKQYVSQAVGSVLHGLSDAERDDIHLILFFAHTDPTVHPSYNQSWTRVLPDTLLKYDIRDEEQITQIKQWEMENNYKKKGLYDYEYLLRACQDTQAEYIVMLEGDVLAVQGWFPRVKSALDVVERSTAGNTPSRMSRNLNTLLGSADTSPSLDTPGQDTPRWLYLRLFYTETYLGWNSEEWHTYLSNSLLIFLFLNLSLILLRRLVPALHLQTHLPNSTLLLITCVFLPISIIFWYMAGRELHPTHSSYAYRMERYGCCSQGLVFSAKQLPLIYKELRAPRMEYIDMMMEAVAEGLGLQRWTIWPSVLQHVGITSSKGDLVADARARMVWNFGFEKYGKGGALW